MISPVFINILSFSGTLYVAFLLRSLSIVKYNIIHIYSQKFRKPNKVKTNYEQ